MEVFSGDLYLLKSLKAFAKRPRKYIIFYRNRIKNIKNETKEHLVKGPEIFGNLPRSFGSTPPTVIQKPLSLLSLLKIYQNLQKFLAFAKLSSEDFCIVQRGQKINR